MNDPRPADKNAENKDAEERAKAAREKLDEVPPPGTDPLHEGP